MDSSRDIKLPRDENGNFVRHVHGLEYYRNFLSLDEQTEVLDLLYSNPWQEGVIARRQQFYGEVYYHTSFKSKILQGYDSGMRKWLDKTMPFFEQEGLMEAPTQVLINEYRNNMGIASHFEDFDAFGPVIVTISLISPVYMTLKKPTTQPKPDGSDNTNINACDSYDDVVKILLEPGSLLIMKDDARFKYRHGIGKYKWINLPSSQELSQCEAFSIKRDDSYRRVSLTIRHLKSTRRTVRSSEDESDTIKDPRAY
eukprot:jgi/Psemu1/200262/e_gw1.254.50.1